MSPWIETLSAKYGAIGIGLLFGTGAKYALTLSEGRRLTIRMVAIDALLIGMVALIASNVVERAGVTGSSAAMISALFAVSSDRVIRLLRERFLRRVDAELQADIARTKGMVREEVQTEISGRAIIDDTISGKAPEEYVALRPKKDKP